MTHLDSSPPDNETIQAAILDARRLAALHATQLLDTPPEASFDRLTRLATDILGVPASFMTLVDVSRDFYKSMSGPGEPLCSVRQWEGPTFCQFLLTQDGPLVLNDVTAHPRYRDLPAVHILGLRAYAGAPLMTSDGRCLGSFCAVDFAPRQWRTQDVSLLTELACSAMREIELRQALQLAMEASQAKSAFLSNMSHEIRTPMNAIMGFTQLMAMNSKDPALSDRLSKVDMSARHLLQILNDILDLSKVEAGKMTLEASLFVLGDLLTSSLDMVRTRADEKGLQLILHKDDLPHQVSGDVTRLRQALLNLLSNAVKFTERGWVCLRVEWLGADAHRVHLRFEVQDTGEGVAPEAQARLFNSFEQADQTISRRHGGTGLGLALTRQLAQLMGGEAGMHSVPGEGSRFWFTAWLGRVEAPAPTPAIDASEALQDTQDVSGLRTFFHGKRVLLAEDDPLSQLVAAELLRMAGLEVDVAGDGAQAVAMAESGGYDIVLLDVQMPEMDGLTVARRLRTSLGKQLPIIAVTANALGHDRQACLAAGMNDHVAKPLNAELLYQSLLRWLPVAEVASH
jgi:signal transduction histidine kinase/ActR/RegA family two-component response regulator